METKKLGLRKFESDDFVCHLPELPSSAVTGLFWGGKRALSQLQLLYRFGTVPLFAIKGDPSLSGFQDVPTKLLEKASLLCSPAVPQKDAVYALQSASGIKGAAAKNSRLHFKRMGNDRETHHRNNKKTRKRRNKTLKEKNYIRRSIVVILGNVLVGLGVAFLRISCFGTDPYTCLSSSISYLFGISYGNASFFISALMLITLLLFGRQFIGLGTVANMLLVGYLSDFFLFVLHHLMKLPEALPVVVRILFLIAAIGIVCFGLAMYLAPELGFSPYEGSGYTIEYRLHIPFKINRIVSDFLCLLIGCIILYSVGGLSLLFNYINIGTVALALLTGPAISFFRPKIEKHI